MKLDYNIIWVEDKIETRPFVALRENLKKYLEDEFFNVKIEFAEDFDGFKKKYETTDVFDLIITDLNLNESHGSEVIDFVRDEKHLLTEIFFYSANSDILNTKLINISRITYHKMDEPNAYRELGSSIIEVINLTISKFQHIVAMRGMIMHETSSLDVEMEKILLQQINTAKNQDDQISVIKNKYLKSNDDFNVEISKMTDLNQILLKIGASQRWRALKRNMPKGEILSILNEYENEIISIRNKFAHAVLEIDENGRKYFKHKEDGIDFNDTLCKKIREDIIKHKINLDKAKEELR